jgi:lipopolysaccharide/colanic/teichoic acid biosynthesis glycosyltransferase
LVLLLVALSDRLTIDSSIVWNAIEALNAAKRETDPLGWFEQDTVLGVIFPEIKTASADVAGKMDARFRCELARRIGVERVSELSIWLYIRPELEPGTEIGPSVIEPLKLQLSSRNGRSGVYDSIKRGLDVFGSLVLLTLLSPLMLLVAALVKLTSPGPVFFRQVRVGSEMKAFTMLKFRTMHANATHALHAEFVGSFIKSSSKVDGAAESAFFKITNDPRVTAVGRILRKTSIDELPQFWNVVRGDMSLVGPRPPLPYEVEQYQRWHRRRILEAKPGITGLWQVMGRSRTTFDEMVRLDIRYAKTRCLWTDLRILLATPKAVIAGTGAC